MCRVSWNLGALTSWTPLGHIGLIPYLHYRIIFWLHTNRSLLAKKFLAFYGNKSSLPYSQAPAICPYPEPDQSRLSIPVLWSNFSNQTKMSQCTLIKHPLTNLLKISSLTPVHYTQTDGKTDMEQHCCKYWLRIRQTATTHIGAILNLRVYIRLGHNRTHPDSV